MKKLSISALAILAIVIAVSSAFTTSKKATAFVGDFYAIQAATNVTLTNFEGTSIKPINVLSTYRQTSSKATGFAQWQVDNVDDPGTDIVICNGANFVCSVEFSGADVDANNLDQTELTNYLSPLSYVHPSTIYYK